MSKKALLILGGLRLGDCFHCIPILTKLKEEGYNDLTWVSGTYEESVVRFLCDWYGYEPVIHYDETPTDIHSRENFLKKYKCNYDYDKYDLVFDNYKQTFEFECPEEIKKYHYLYGLPKREAKSKVVVQPDTTSSFKRVPSIYEVDYLSRFKELVSIGGTVDQLIEGSKMLRGASWKNVYEELKDAKMFVGLHSAVMCFAFYTGIPMITLFFWESLFSFKQFRPNIVELLQPSKEQIEQAIDELQSKL